MQQLDQPTRRGFSHFAIAVVVALHFPVFVYGTLHPQSMLQFDRASSRLAAARLLSSPPAGVSCLDILATHGTVGDYAWHGLFLWLARGWTPAVQMFQLALLLASMVALRRMTQDLGGSGHVSRTAVLLYAVLPIDFMVPHFLGSEAVFTPLLIGGTWLVVRYAQRSGSPRDLVLAGLLYTLGALTRPEILAWIPVMLALMVPVTRKRVGRRAWVHLPLLAVCTLAGPVLWASFQSARAGAWGYGRSDHDLGGEIQQRVRLVRQVAAGADPVGSSQEASQRGAGALLAVAVEHPAAFARVWVSQTIKLLALPDNLDFFAYIQAYRRTGERAGLVHTLGWAETIRRVYHEMPFLVLWLLASVALFMVFWMLALLGMWTALRRSRGTRRLAFVLLLSLPVAYVGLRCLTQGESRKRSSVDFVLVTFAALGIEAAHAARRRPHPLPVLAPSPDPRPA